MREVQTIITPMRPSHSPRRAFVVWFVFGVAFASLIQFVQAQAFEGVDGLVYAGSLQEVHVLVKEQLPNARISDGFGHDGQIFYAVGLDLRGGWVPDTLLSSPYRYRRILYPALSSGFGLFDGYALLWGMVLIANVSIGVASGAMAAVATKLGLRRWVPGLVVANPGLWLSATLLTADSLAFALGTLGLLAVVYRREGWAIAALAAAALTKEPSIAFAVGIAGYAWFGGERLRATRLMAGSIVPMILWWGYIAAAIGNPLDSGGNVVAPFTGMVAAFDVWTQVDHQDVFYLAATLVGVAASIWALARRSHLWGWLVAPWLLIAVSSSDLVWNLGNNSVRAFAPLFTFGLIGATSARTPTGPRLEPKATDGEPSLS